MFGELEKSAAWTAPRGKKGWSVGQPEARDLGASTWERSRKPLREFWFSCARVWFSRPAHPERGASAPRWGRRRVQRRTAWSCLVATSRLRTLSFGHGEILGLPGRRWLLSYITGFAFAFLWLPGELSSEEMSVGCVDSTVERRGRCRGMEVAGPGSCTSLSSKAAPGAELPSSFVSWCLKVYIWYIAIVLFSFFPQIPLHLQTICRFVLWSLWSLDLQTHFFRIISVQQSEHLYVSCQGMLKNKPFFPLNVESKLNLLIFF